MKMCHFWTQNGGSICPNQSISKNLLRNLVPIIEAYLYSKVRYQSINEIVTIKEYWKLIGREPFLAIITWEPDFSHVCSFCRMLKGHKNFRFTTNPDKTHRTLVALSGCPTRETTKEELFVGNSLWKLPKTDDNDNIHKNDENTLSWHMVNASLNKCLKQAFQVTSLGCSKTCYLSNIILEENKLPHITYCLFL